MKKFLLILSILLMAVLSIMIVSAQDTISKGKGLRPDAPLYALRGSYQVGTMEFIVDNGERPLPLTIWYPAASDEVEAAHTYSLAQPPLSFFGTAIPDAATVDDNLLHPLVLYSHGASGVRFASLYLTEHLASHGFVVMAPDHTGDTFSNAMDTQSFIKSHATRPVDITRVIDFAEELTTEGKFEGFIDTERIAIVGMSSGAWTAFLAGGAQRDYRALESLCNETPDDWVCDNLLGTEEYLAELMGYETIPEGLWPSVEDTRVDVIVALAPGSATAFGAEGLASIGIPTMILMGSEDMFLPYETYGPATYEAITGEPKALVTFQGASHMFFGNSCRSHPFMVNMGMFWACSDPVWDMDRAHDLVDYFTTAFLLAELYEDEAARAALAPDAIDFPGILYEAMGY